jgi:hypothetical protein
LGIEQVLSAQNGPRVTVVTKSKIAAELLLGPKAADTRQWALNSRAKPLKVVGFSKQFFQKVFEQLQIIADNDLGSVMYVPDEPNGGLLSARSVHLDVDPEKDYAGSAPGTEEANAGDIKQRHLLRQELTASGARGTRSAKQLTKQQRRRIAATEGHAEKKKDTPIQTTTTTPQKHADNTATTADTPKGNPHSGLAAAIALEELRAADRSGRGADAAHAAVAGNVQEPEHGASGRGGETAQGAGEHQSAPAVNAEHVQ